MRLQSATLAVFLTATAATADVPNVVTDIAPVHSLVALVMGDLGDPTLLTRAYDDPHHMQLRPSQARDLTSADAVFWIGADLTPWLEDALTNLADNATVTALRPPNANSPHGWLNPDNARAWLTTVARVLADLDPENSQTYLTNANAADADIAQLTKNLELILTPLQDQNLIFAHDAYGPFTDRFNLRTAAVLRDSGAATPGAAHLSDIRDLLQSGTIACAFHEPTQIPNQLVSLTKNTDVLIAVLDPAGVTLKPGPELYRLLMENLAAEIADCVNN